MKKLEKLFSQGVIEGLKIALAEVGEIEPWLDEETGCWVFCSPLYPSVEAPGATKEECIQRYQGWLAQFIEERLKGNIHLKDEARTSGRGGCRPGTGRPKGPSEIRTRDGVFAR